MRNGIVVLSCLMIFGMYAQTGIKQEKLPISIPRDARVDSDDVKYTYMAQDGSIGAVYKMADYKKRVEYIKNISVSQFPNAENIVKVNVEIMWQGVLKNFTIDLPVLKEFASDDQSKKNKAFLEILKKLEMAFFEQIIAGGPGRGIPATEMDIVGVLTLTYFPILELYRWITIEAPSYRSWIGMQGALKKEKP